MTEYQKYQLQWMIDHGYSLDDLIHAIDEVRFCDPEDFDHVTDPLPTIFKEWESDYGFGSEIWACEEEWESCGRK